MFSDTQAQLLYRHNQTAAIFRAFASILFRITSIVTARIMTEPIMTYCASVEIPIRFSPFRMTPIRSAPTSVPQMVPLPPVKEAPQWKR